jgi:predicted ATPase
VITIVTSTSLSLRRLRKHATAMHAIGTYLIRLPELTPHAKQADLAERLIAEHDLGHAVLCATSMELVILRLMRRVREGKIKPSDLHFVVLDKSGEGWPIRVDDAGECLDVWPEGFFDSRMPELF